MSKIFLNNNHIQGNDKSQIYLGLYYNEELISVMTFGSPRIAMGNKNKNYNKNSYELIRFCNKLNTNVVGGASKLLKYFIKNYKPEHIFSFADLRWSNPNQNLYINIGKNIHIPKFIIGLLVIQSKMLFGRLAHYVAMLLIQVQPVFKMLIEQTFL